MSRVEERKNVLVVGVINGDNKFSKRIEIPFIPDEIVLNGITVYTRILIDDIFMVYSNLLDDPIMIEGTKESKIRPGGDLPRKFNQFIHLDLHFKNSKPVNGLYTFQFVDPINEYVPSNLVGTFVFHFSFIKYFLEQ